MPSHTKPIEGLPSQSQRGGGGEGTFLPVSHSVCPSTMRLFVLLLIVSAVVHVRPLRRWSTTCQVRTGARRAGSGVRVRQQRWPWDIQAHSLSISQFSAAFRHFRVLLHYPEVIVDGDRIPKSFRIVGCSRLAVCVHAQLSVPWVRITYLFVIVLVYSFCYDPELSWTNPCSNVRRKGESDCERSSLERVRMSSAKRYIKSYLRNLLSCANHSHPTKLCPEITSIAGRRAPPVSRLAPLARPIRTERACTDNVRTPIMFHRPVDLRKILYDYQGRIILGVVSLVWNCLTL